MESSKFIRLGREEMWKRKDEMIVYPEMVEAIEYLKEKLWASFSLQIAKRWFLTF